MKSGQHTSKYMRVKLDWEGTRETGKKIAILNSLKKSPGKGPFEQLSKSEEEARPCGMNLRGCGQGSGLDNVERNSVSQGRRQDVKPVQKH